jgi:hypothetical protein
MRDETNDRDVSSRVDFGAEGGRRIWAGGGRTVGAEGGAGDLRELLARLDVLDHGLVESREVLVPVLRRWGGGRGSGAGPRGEIFEKGEKERARSEAAIASLAPPRRHRVARHLRENDRARSTASASASASIRDATAVRPRRRAFLATP